MPKYKELLGQKEALNKELEKIDDGLKKLYTESNRVYSDGKVASKQWFRLAPPQDALNVWRKLGSGSNKVKFSHSKIVNFTAMGFEPLDNLVARDGGVNRWWWNLFDQRKFYDVMGQRKYFGIDSSNLPHREYITYMWSAHFADNYIRNISDPFQPFFIGEYIGDRAYTEYEGSYRILKSGNVNILALQNAFKQSPDMVFVLQNPTEAKIYAATEDDLLAKRSPIQEKIKALEPQITQAMEEERLRVENEFKKQQEENKLKQKRDNAVIQTFDKRIKLLEEAVDKFGKQKLDFDQYTISNMTELEGIRRDLREIDAQSVQEQEKTDKEVSRLGNEISELRSESVKVDELNKTVQINTKALSKLDEKYDLLEKKLREESYGSGIGLARVHDKISKVQEDIGKELTTIQEKNKKINKDLYDFEEGQRRLGKKVSFLDDRIDNKYSNLVSRIKENKETSEMRYNKLRRGLLEVKKEMGTRVKYDVHSNNAAKRRTGTIPKPRIRVRQYDAARDILKSYLSTIFAQYTTV